HVPPDATGRAPSSAIKAKLGELRETYPRPQARDPKTKAPKPGPAIAFSSYSLEELARILEGEGLNMVKFPLYAGTMGPASTLTNELVATGRLDHDGDAV